MANDYEEKQPIPYRLAHDARRNASRTAIEGVEEPRKPFITNVPKDYVSVDVEDRRHDNIPGDKAAGTLNYR
jgi:hypothetical protein